MKKARRRLEILVPAAMLCLSSVCSSRTIGACKTKYACIVEADESMRIRMEGTPRRYHEDHIAEKGMNSIHDSLQSRSQIYSCASSNENTRCKGSSGDRMGKTWEITGMAADESQKQKWSARWSKELRAEKYILRHWWISVILRIRSWTHNFKNTNVESYLQWFRILCSIHRTRIFSITNDGRKRNGRHCKKTRMRGTSSRRFFRLHPGQNGRCTGFTEKSEVRMSRYLHTSTETRIAQIMVQYGRPSRSSWTTSVRSSSGRTTEGKAIWESFFLYTVGTKFQIGNADSYTEKKVLFLSCMWTK